jgi:arsenate reductase (thioredoxin)
MAAALFNRHARVVEVMREIGIDVETAKPRLLTGELAADTVRVITMGCADECPVVNAPMEDWGLTHPTGQPLEAVRERFAMTSIAVSVFGMELEI